MIDRKLLTDTIDNAIKGSDIFIVDITVSADNNIVVELDSTSGIDIDTCASITRAIEAAFDRDADDYSLEVGSAGLTAPFKVRGQYVKNLGNQIEVLTADGRKLRGTLTDINDEGSQFTVTTTKKVKEPGAKRPIMVEEPQTIAVADTKSVKYLIDFK